MVACVLVGQAALAAEYFVATNGSDGADGLAHSNAWATVQHAVDSVIPGDTITVLEGQHTGCRIAISGAEYAPITLRADTPGSVVLNAVSPAGYHSSIIDFDSGPAAGVGYWNIEGFTVTGASRYGIALFGFDAARHHHIRIVGNHVDSNGVTGIFTAFSDDIHIESNVSSRNGEHGVYISNSSNRPRVIHNELRDNAAAGVHLNGDAGMGGSGIITDAIIQENVIAGNGFNGGAGVNMDGVVGGRVVNNLIVDNHASGLALFKGDAAEATRNIDVFHNTVVLSEDGRWAVTMTSAGAVSNRFFNNILYTRHAWRGTYETIDPVPVGFESDFNVVMNRFSVDGGDTRIDFNAWQARGHDSHSLISTPPSLFRNVSSQDYRLSADSPAIDNGRVLDSVPADIDGALRPYGRSSDIGCYEWSMPGLQLIITQTTATARRRAPNGVIWTRPLMIPPHQ